MKVVKPKVTVIVINYNSQNKWHITEYCFKRIFSLNYRPLEIIVVDNGSTDGSYELIKQLAKTVKQDNNFTVRIVRLSKNYGFAVANIIAYKLRDPRSRYVALINNDLAPEPDSLEELVKVLEKHPKFAGIQGVILTWDGRYIDTYGVLMSEHGIGYCVASFMGSTYVRKLSPFIVTYVDGAFSIYRVEALEESGGLFMPYFFMWGDDYELGIRLWRSSYMLMAIPIIVGRHYRGASTLLNERKILEPPCLPYILEYWYWVSNIAVTVVLYGYPYPLQLLKRIPTALIAALLKRSKAILLGFLDGVKLGFKLRRLLLRQKPWLRFIQEPRLKSRMLWELALFTKFYLRYGKRASQIYFILVARSLGYKVCSKSDIVYRKLKKLDILTKS
jgi:GT2 family glycosyltransferase